MPNRRAHDIELIDALEAVDPVSISAAVWRITRTGDDPLRGSSANGRWAVGDGHPVLYTSLEASGALAEIGYRLGLEPVWPSRLHHELHEIDASVGRTLRLVDMAALAALGVDSGRYTSLEYDRTQAISAAAHFLEFDGLLVPSARADCLNLVIFLDQEEKRVSLDILRSEPVDWETWRSENR